MHPQLLRRKTCEDSRYSLRFASLQATRKALEAADVYLPRFAWRELDAIIDCGVLEKGEADTYWVHTRV